jgi:hypothetical protein
MKKQRALFCWLLGSLTLAGVAVAASTTSTAPASPAPPAASAPQAQAADSAPATAPTQTPQAAPKQSGQIWECVTNGVKTFSNNPCGNKATRVALRPINTMKPTPVIRSAYAVGPEPRYTKEYTDRNLYPDQDASGQGFDDNSSSDVQGYPGVQGFAYLPLNRANHNHRRAHHHDSTSEPQRPAPKPQNSTPASQRPMSAPRKN